MSGAASFYEMPSPTEIARLAATRAIDFTTVGRRSGQPARIEIWWFQVADRFIITGTPGKRDWFANINMNPKVTIHAPFGDFSGRAVVIDDQDFRRTVFTSPHVGWYKSQSQLDALVATAPMIEVVLD